MNEEKVSTLPESAERAKSNKFNKRGPRKRESFNRPKTDLEDKVIDIRRVTKVVKGGRQFRFAATVVVGNRKGKVGIGTGKAK